MDRLVRRPVTALIALLALGLLPVLTGCGGPGGSHLLRRADRAYTAPAPGVNAVALANRVGGELTATVSQPAAWEARYVGDDVIGVRTTQREVALTFDDGPSAYTRQIVDALDAAGAHATFFVVGSRITTDAIRYSTSHGEEIANHTWDHPDMRHLTSAEASAEIGLTNARITRITGTDPAWFRSPFSRLYPVENEQMRAHGLLYADWTIATDDWMPGVDTASIVARVERGLAPGAVIVMHDGPAVSADALPEVLRAIQARGYRMVTLSDMAKTAEPDRRRLRLGVLLGR